MLAILATHPIQYQVPLWQMLARETSVPFEVWYMSEHAIKASRDQEFGTTFAWDLDMLKGYPHRFLKMHAGATPNTPLRMRIAESLPQLFKTHDVEALWVQGWQVAAYWQAVWAARKAGVEVWLRGESNNLAPTPWWKQIPKRILLGQLFRRVDHFLCIGTANRELYRSYGVPESKLHMTPYAVDNERFARQAQALRGQRSEIRGQWGIPEDSYCALFCGKFIPKKRPLDLIKATQLLLNSHPELKTHLLFVGSGELGAKMRAECNVVFDADASRRSEISSQQSDNREPITNNQKPSASFAGFLNQRQISKAYIAADVLVLPSDYSETWGLVVNEAMASGLRCLISDRCGCALDLAPLERNFVFPCGDIGALANILRSASDITMAVSLGSPPPLQGTANVVASLYGTISIGR
jgi:glycosyltransferase involved in cell wall biosynthesis